MSQEGETTVEKFTEEAKKLESLAEKTKGYFKVDSIEEAVKQARSWADFCDQTGSGNAAVNYDTMMHCLDDKQYGEAVYELIDLVQNDEYLNAWMNMKGMRTKDEKGREADEAFYFDKYEKKVPE